MKSKVQSSIGYDVWMMNVRGNEYSKGHKSLDTCSSCRNYWSFGLDEPARFDYPASIDYILEATSQKDLFYVGYSMGSAHYAILLSELPEYNRKIRAGFLMGPAIFLGNSAAVLKLGKPLFQYVLNLLDYFNIFELATKSIASLSHYACTKDETHASYCHKIWNYVGTTDSQDLDLKTSLIQLSNIPSGSSLKTYKHFLQLLDGSFTKYSYDARTNLKLYGTPTAPQYNLDNVRVPTKIYVGQSDPLTSLKDAQKLSAALPKSLGVHVVERQAWNHIDFGFSAEAHELVFNHLISDMNRFQNKMVLNCTLH